jgi:4-hydroxy-tetrahydrodipicolinate synthase
MYQGSYVAVVTPFTRKDEVDYDRLAELVEMHIAAGTAGLVPCGTTGESCTLSMAEHKAVIKFVVKRARGRVPVIAGTGANSTKEAIELTVAAAKAGADATLQVSPYYNKPEPEGMFRHFKAIAEAARLPIVLYSVPSRTAREIALETVVRLAAEVKEVVAIKEAGGSLDRVSDLVQKCPSIDVLSGDDSLTLPMMSVGAKGVISVAANFIPGDVAAMAAAALAGDFARARALHLKMYPVFKACFFETNPIPVKTAMELTGLCRGDLRLPLSAMGDANRERLRKALADYGLVKR